MKEEKSNLEKAMDLIKEKRIFRIIDETNILEDHFKIEGKNREYLVSLPNFCTCEHFVFIFLIVCIQTYPQVFITIICYFFCLFLLKKC